MRQSALSLAACLWAVLATGPTAAAQTEIPGDVQLVTGRTQQCVARGLAYLHTQCSPEGWIGNKTEFKVATTALAGLAFLANGNTPGRGKYGDAIERAIRYFIDLANSNKSTGYIREQGGKSRMHGHAYATLFLAQVYGMTRDEASREKIGNAIKAALRTIEGAQDPKGGWGYDPGDRTHEGSITVCCLQAMRASRNAGFKVKRQTILNAIRYMIASANDDGSFKYRLGGGRSHSTYPLTAAAISTMNAFGVYDTRTKRIMGKDFPRLPGVMRRGMRFMDRYTRPGAPEDRYYTNFYYYAEFYAAQAYFKSRFDGRGRQWNRYYARTRDQLLSKFNNSRGCWPHQRYGDAYATSIATMILQIPYKYLPIFQR